MKQIVLILTTLVWSFMATAQKNSFASIDSLVKNGVYRGINAPDEVHSDNAGATILRIFVVDDSVKVSSLYASGLGYDYTNERHLVKSLNQKLRGQIPVAYDVIIPLFFHYNDGVEYAPSEEVQMEVNKKIKKLKRNYRVLETATLTTILTHIHRAPNPSPVIVRENE